MKYLLLIFLTLGLAVEKDDQIPFKIFTRTCERLWRHVKAEASRFEVSTVVPEMKFIKTTWMDNTLAQKDHFESFPYLTSEVQFIISLGSGTWKDIPACRVAILRRQRVLEESSYDWINVLTDGVDETVFFYRLKKRLAMEENLRKKQN